MKDTIKEEVDTSVLSDKFSTPEYRRSRAAYAAQCTCEYLLSILVTDAFLAKLLGSMGIEDSIVGIISSFVTLAFVIQIFSLFLYKWKMTSKKIVLMFYPLSRFLFSFLYVIPFLPIGGATVKIIVMIFILVAYFSKYLVYNVIYKWSNSFVEPDRRASFSATKELISLACGIVFTALVGFFFDRFEAMGRINDGFLMLAIFAFIISACDVICLLLIKNEDAREVRQSKKKFSDIIQNTLKNKNFRSVILFTVIWDMARYFTVGFLGTFKVNDLLISVFIVQLMNILGNVSRMIVTKPFGRFSDKHSFAIGMEVALAIVAVGYLLLMFTTPKTWYFIAIFTVLNAVSLAGLNQNSFNIAYSYVDVDYITEALAIKNCIGGVFGFGASLLGGKILKYIQDNGNTLFGFHVYGQQVLAGISLVLVIAAFLLIVFVIGKQKVMKQ